MHLNLFAHGCGHHSAAWRAPGSAVDRLGDVTWWEELARTAERGRFDAFFLADGQSLSPVPGPSWFLEPVTALTALARATTRIGLVSTISSTFWDPFHAARLSAGLDHISGGRAGINVVTSMTDAEARNHGMDRLPDHEERYARAAEYGRDPDNLVIMPGLVTFVGATEEEARAKQRELNELLPVADSLRQLSFFVGRDTSGWALDEPVPDLPPLAEFTGPAGRYATILRILASSPNGRPTVRDLLGYLAAGGGYATFVGTPEQIADEMERWVVNGAADGFNLMPPTLPGGLDDVVDLVVPVLQERGLFRREYPAGTLRGHLTSRCRHHAA